MFKILENIFETCSPTLDVQQVRWCENYVDNVHALFKNLFIEDGIMDIPLCIMILMLVVKPTL